MPKIPASLKKINKAAAVLQVINFANIYTFKTNSAEESLQELQHKFWDPSHT